MSLPLLAAVEAGGTKFVCGVGTGPDDLHTTRFPTEDPATTLAAAKAFFAEQRATRGEISALGVGTFGPADIDPNSGKFGHILNTPKPGWKWTDLLGDLLSELGDIPAAFDTDVNAAAWGEMRWGAAQGLADFVYITVGTGIGGGAVSGGRLVHGTSHPEIGHLRIPRHETDRNFKGTCPFHADCLEGLAAGPALEKRWGQNPKSLAIDHPAWDLEARHLADALVNLSLTLAPQRFILGGGVMDQPQVFPLLRKHFLTRVAGYRETPQIEEFIVPPGLGSRAGVLGALALAADALEASPR